MSLELHLSAKSDELLAALRPALAAARANTLTAGNGIPRPIPVLVPSAQMGDWLQVRLARELGLSMGFEFLRPDEYFSQRLAIDAGTADFARAYALWSPQRLRWLLFPLVGSISEHLGHDESKELAPRDRFAFAQLLSQQFDRYARYRPDWPDLWDHDRSAWSHTGADLTADATNDESWQRRLWRSLAVQGDTPSHPARLLRELGTTTAAESGAPVFVIGTGLLDPLLLRTLMAFSQRGYSIALYLLLPSLGYLGDISRRKKLKDQLVAITADPPEAIGGHPLLASLGQQAVGTFLLLDQVSQDYAQWPEPDSISESLLATASLLQRLQFDIRQQRTPSAADPSVQLNTLSTDDQSLRIHCCHSPRRELEVLRDELLRAFRDLPDLQPEEVLIAVTDFEVYAPLAVSILRSGTQILPVRLTAIPAREANPIAVALLSLLQMSLGRYTASELLSLLNLTAVQQHLNLAGETHKLTQLADATRASGLTHGIGNTGDATGTWRAALDRLLAGAWFGPIAKAQDGGGIFVHPIAADLHHNDDNLLQFVGWLTELAIHLQTWQEPAPAAIWATRLEKAVDELLHSDANDDHATAVRRQLGELAGVAATNPLDAGTILDWLQPQLDNATSLRTNMGGEILLGRLEQLSGLPCRVLAILGLQDGAFPRAIRRPAWDLLSYRPERWDTDPRNQDRQWFLDSLLTPTDRLILSASNRSLRTAHDGPLSSCVEELLRVASATVRPADCQGLDALEKQIVIRHRIQPFAEDYFSDGTNVPHSFDSGAARIARDIKNAADDKLRPFLSAQPTNVEDPEIEPTALTLEQLARFWKEPARAWLRAMQLNVFEDESDDTALDDPPLSLDPLQSYGIRDSALQTRLATGDVTSTEVTARLIADRALPPGALGNLAWEQIDRLVEPLANGLAPLRLQTSLTPISIDLGAGFQLTGETQVGEVNTETPWILIYRPGDYDKKPRYQLEAFIFTLATAVQLNRPVACRVLGVDNPSGKQLPAIAPDIARQHLNPLVAGFVQGKRMPLCYAPKTSDSMVAALAKDDEAAALDVAESKWNDDAGDGTTPFASLAWRDADPFAPPLDKSWLHWARVVAWPLNNWWNQRTAPVLPSSPNA